VIATDHGGARETVWPNESGWLVPPNNAEALAVALERALSLSQIERETMAANGRDNVMANFTVSLMCDRIMAVYQSLLG
jgi:glycosyltransferase involved in cell wall biosynthesis